MKETSTLRQLAELSGVSVATVSRALNGREGVSDAVRARVQAAARELDYVPSAAAQTLVRRRSNLIGVVLDTGEGHPDLQSPFFFHAVMAGLRHYHGTDGEPDLMLFASARGDARSLLTRIRKHRVDGLVIVALDEQREEVAGLEEINIPCVTVDMHFNGVCSVDVASDDRGGAAMAVRHLYSLGHRCFGMIAIPEYRKLGRERLLGFRHELERIGLVCADDYVVDGDEYPESGDRALRRLLSLPEPPSAIFVANDLMAAGALQAAFVLDVRVPEQVAIVGFDDIPLAGLTQPRLTTIRQDAVGLGRAALATLHDLIANPTEDRTDIVLPVELVVRETCGGDGAHSAFGDGPCAPYLTPR